MSYSNANIKKICQCKSKDTVSSLIRTVKTQRLRHADDLLQVNQLSICILDQWKIIKNKYRKKAIRNVIYNDAVYAEHEAQSELVIGLLFLLNDKLHEFVLSRIFR